jgi:hypothetical protein
MSNQEKQAACPKCGSTQLTANKKGFREVKQFAGPQADLNVSIDLTSMYRLRG